MGVNYPETISTFISCNKVKGGDSNLLEGFQKPTHKIVGSSRFGNKTLKMVPSLPCIFQQIFTLPSLFIYNFIKQSWVSEPFVFVSTLPSPHYLDLFVYIGCISPRLCELVENFLSGWKQVPHYRPNNVQDNRNLKHIIPWSFKNIVQDASF